jgi:hypothetical protein
VGYEVHNLLTVNDEDHAEYAVGRRVLGPDIDVEINRLELALVSRFVDCHR